MKLHGMGRKAAVMTLILIGIGVMVSITTLTGCPKCRKCDAPQAAVASGTDLAVEDATVWMGKPAMWQCDMKCESMYDALVNSENAGVNAIESKTARLDRSFCKACFTCPSGEYNLIKIKKSEQGKLPKEWEPVEEKEILPWDGCK